MACGHTRQRPKIVEKSDGDIELKARSQPTGTRFSACTSDGCDLGPLLIGADTLSRSPLSVRSTDMGLEIIPSVLGNDGNDGNEIRVIVQSAVAKMVRRITDLRISPSHPREHTQQTSGIALSSSRASLDIHKLEPVVAAP